MNNISAGRIDWIESSRGIAAISVLLWHLSTYVAPYGQGTLGRILQPASVFAVDLFFVLSGFVMMRATAGSARNSPVEFLARRLLRIYPLYLITTVATVCIFPALAQASFLVPSLLFQPGPSPADAPVYGFPIVVVGWTLNYEMYFYLVFALALCAGRYRWLAVLIWAIVLAILPSALNGQIQFDLSATNHFLFANASLNLITNPMALLFASGVMIGLMYERGVVLTGTKIALALRTAATIAIVTQYAFGFQTYHGPLGAGLSIIPFVWAFSCTQSVPIGGMNVLRYLGKISFALYVTHPFVINMFGISGHHGRLGYAYMAMVAVASIGAAVVAHHFVEAPIARAGNKTISAAKSWRRRWYESTQRASALR